MDIMQEIDIVETKTKNIWQEVMHRIHALPDNPNIVRIGPSGKAFEVRYSNIKELNCNLSPYYHDFLEQYQGVIAELIHVPVHKIIEHLDWLLENKLFTLRERKGWAIHPGVIDNLKKAFFPELMQLKKRQDALVQIKDSKT